MNLALILDRLDQIERGCADLLNKHRQAMDDEDLQQARKLQGEISDLIARVQNLKSEIGREKSART
jgi:hypothetical protein